MQKIYILALIQLLIICDIQQYCVVNAQSWLGSWSGTNKLDQVKQANIDAIKGHIHDHLPTAQVQDTVETAQDQASNTAYNFTDKLKQASDQVEDHVPHQNQTFENLKEWGDGDHWDVHEWAHDDPHHQGDHDPYNFDDAVYTQSVSREQGFSAISGRFPSCYGYGDVYGTPSTWLRSDMYKVRDFQVSNRTDNTSTIYMSGIRYYFEGVTLLQAVYSDSADPHFLDDGWEHGTAQDLQFQKFTPGFFNLSGQENTINVPVVYFDKKGNLAAISFQEHQYAYEKYVPGYLDNVASIFGSDEQKEQVSKRFTQVEWLLEGFQSDATELTTSDPSFGGYLQEVKQHKMSSYCEQLLQQSDSQVVGFATTTNGPFATQIKSFQAIYFSSNANVCKCLAATPEVNEQEGTKVQAETTNVKWTWKRFWNRFNKKYKDFVIISIVLALLVAILGCLAIATYLRCRSKMTGTPVFIAMSNEFFMLASQRQTARRNALDKAFMNLTEHGIMSQNIHQQSRRMSIRNHSEKKLNDQKQDLSSKFYKSGSNDAALKNKSQVIAPQTVPIQSSTKLQNPNNTNNNIQVRSSQVTPERHIRKSVDGVQIGRNSKGDKIERKTTAGQQSNLNDHVGYDDDFCFKGNDETHSSNVKLNKDNFHNEKRMRKSYDTYSNGGIAGAGVNGLPQVLKPDQQQFSNHTQHSSNTQSRFGQVQRQENSSQNNNYKGQRHRRPQNYDDWGDEDEEDAFQ